MKISLKIKKETNLFFSMPLLQIVFYCINNSMIWNSLLTLLGQKKMYNLTSPHKYVIPSVI